jgi:hypothetical protein
LATGAPRSSSRSSKSWSRGDPVRRGSRRDQPKGSAPLDVIDVARTAAWYDRFFWLFPDYSAESLLDAAARERFDLEQLLSAGDLADEGFYGWSYWLLFLRGYLDFVRGAAT